LSGHRFSHSFPLLAISFAIILPVFAFLLEPTVNLFEFVFKLDLSIMQLLIKLLQLDVLDFAGSGEFGDLLRHEVDVALVLAGQSLLFQLNLVEAFVQSPQLPCV
jgi:hypothetical protein